MIIEKIRLFNIRQHKDITIDFKNMSTMILGANGSGKSTIVESIYYLLFREILAPNVSVFINDGIQTIDSKGNVKYNEKSFIEGWFTHKGISYHLLTGLAKTNSLLEIYKNEEWVKKSNKIKEIYEYLKNEVLDGMTSEYFINTVYTEQMGILNLVSSSETTRQKEFDKLIDITKFQTIYECLGVPYKALNKLVRNDIPELDSKLTDINLRLSGLKEEESETSRKEQDFNNRVNDLRKIIISVSTEFEDLQVKYNSIYNDYISLNQKNTSLNNTKILLESKKKELNDLTTSVDFESMKTDHEKLIQTIETTYNDIVLKANETLNFFKSEKKTLNDEIERLNYESNLIDNIQFINNGIKDASDQINRLNENLINAKETLKELNSTLDYNKKELSLLEKDISKLKDNIRELTLVNKTILNSYKNENFNFENINKFFNDEIDEYSFENVGDMKCLYCSSIIHQTDMIKRMEDDKSKFLNNLNKISNLDSELLLKYESKELLEETINNLAQECSKEESVINYSSMTVKESTRKISELKIEKEKYLDTLKDESLTKAQILKMINIHKGNLDSIDSLTGLNALYAFKDENITSIHEHNIQDIIADIEKLNDCKTKESQIKNGLLDYSVKEKYIQENITTHEASVNEISLEIENILKSYNIKSVEELYNQSLEMHKSLERKTAEKVDLEKQYAIIDVEYKAMQDKLSNLRNNISYLEKDASKLKKTILKNEKINTLISRLNIAKSYFKQDGLAKHIRKFYIEKINKKMSEYVHLFNFDFLPKIDDTAGIENYHKYSGGQKIAIAILMKIILNFILNNPIKMMILDEPTPYMDAERVEAIKDLIISIKDHLQVITITHDEEFMNIDCNKIMF